MKEDVIDLSSDGEDCYEDSHDEVSSRSSGAVDKKPSSMATTRQFEAVGLIENHGLPGRAIKESSSTRKDFQKDDYGSGSSGIRQVQDKKIHMDERIRKDEMVNDSSQSTKSTRTTFLGASSLPSGPTAPMLQKQISRRFWKAGDYDVQAPSTRALQNGMDHVRVHPKFLHSNATSHKWALGAIAELLDNAIDEVSTGATYVSVDKVSNPRDNSPALLVQDDGGGMDPDCMRHCMSLGYSRKTSNTTIGQYGNGFKTSTMRLGADVLVFSRCSRNSSTTQSIGLLSYTFLRATGHEDIVVPMVDFELSPTDGKPKMLVRTTKDDWLNNLSTVLQWSPYATELELLKQFDDIGWHGTKIVVYNLWLNDDGDLELDFDTDNQDIQVRGAPKLEKSDTLQKQLTHQHIATRLRFSLRAYASILYLQMPSNFQIILRGKVVEHLSIVDDLKFAERILYKPQVGNSRDFNVKEVSVITTIGFAKEAPMVSVHGFNVYHKNRLIMPFWKVFQENSSRGRGVVGVLEANFIEPAHDKQDFERTPILQRLETRLKQMTIEYWTLHCELIGYQPPKQSSKGRSASNAQYTVSGIPAGLNPAEANATLNPQNDGRHGETTRACNSISPTETNLKNNNGSASAPSTPPQPGSDAVCKPPELVPGEKSEDRKIDVSAGDEEAENVTNIQGATCGKGSCNSEETIVAKLEGQDTVLVKRSAAGICLPDLGGSSKRQVIRRSAATGNQQQILGTAKDGSVSIQMPPNLNLPEVIEELEQLRSSCADYRRREEELKSKVAELERELLESKRKLKLLVGERPVLKRPKEEC